MNLIWVEQGPGCEIYILVVSLLNQVWQFRHWQSAMCIVCGGERGKASRGSDLIPPGFVSKGFIVAKNRISICAFTKAARTLVIEPFASTLSLHLLLQLRFLIACEQRRPLSSLARHILTSNVSTTRTQLAEKEDSVIGTGLERAVL